MIVVTVNAGSVQIAFAQLSAAIENPRPVLYAIGEHLLDDTKKRFATSTAPDGSAWAKNSELTIARFIAGVKGNFNKAGEITKKGLASQAAKKPLIGKTRDLSRQMYYRVVNDGVAIGNTMVYAAMQNYGGMKAQFPHLWGNIPARPYMPVMAGNEPRLYPRIEADVMRMIAQYLRDSVRG